MTKMYKIWIGKRESDILTYNFFDYSITFYGSNGTNNKSFCVEHRTKYSESKFFLNFVLENINEIIKKNKNCEIHFYNNILAYKLLQLYPALKKYIANLNDYSVLNILRHKTLSRLWLCNCVETPDFCLLSKDECNILNLQKKFNNKYSSFVIQKNYSGGGTGTYLMHQNNQNIIIEKLDDNELYLVSPFYYPNRSFSCHAMIDCKKYVIFPILEQSFYTENCQIEYAGNTYVDSQLGLATDITASAKKVCLKLQKIGYKGVCGFDYLLVKNKIMLVEINPRYQGSSFVVNNALKEHNLPSLFELNDMCFNEEIPENIIDNIKSLKINSSNMSLHYRTPDDINNANNILNKEENIVFLDGFLNTKTFEKESYLLRYISPCTEF